MTRPSILRTRLGMMALETRDVMSTSLLGSLTNNLPSTSSLVSTVTSAASTVVDALPAIDDLSPTKPGTTGYVKPGGLGAIFAAGTEAGTKASAALLDSDGKERFRVVPYGDNFTGGVRVATGDINNDGIPDLITAPGAGRSADVKVFSGLDGSPLQGFPAFELSFTGGAFVATADINGDGNTDIIVSPDQSGGPRVRILDGSTQRTIADFYAIDDPNFRGGVRVSVGDMNGDGRFDLAVAAGIGGGPRIAVFDGVSLVGDRAARLIGDFFAFEPSLRNGAYISLGDVNDDGFADIVFGGGPGGGPRILTLDGKQMIQGKSLTLGDFFAGNQESRDGVRVGVAPGPDGRFGILAGGASGLNRFDLNGTPVDGWNPFGPQTTGLSVGSCPITVITRALTGN